MAFFFSIKFLAFDKIPAYHQNPWEISANQNCFYDYLQLILLQTQNKGKKRESKCESCDITFTDRNEFAQHFEDVHEGKKPFKCTLCDKTFLEKLGMKKHVETVHEGIKLYQCHVCDKSFGWHGMLKRHISAVHNKAKPFQCSQCETRFTENTR